MGRTLHRLLQRGPLDRADPSDRLDYRRRRHVGDGVQDSPADETDFLANRPEQDFTDSDLRDMQVQRPVAEAPDPDARYRAMLQKQARIPMYERKVDFDEDERMSDGDWEHPLFRRQESPDESYASVHETAGTARAGGDDFDIPGMRQSFREGSLEAPAPQPSPPTLTSRYAKKGFAQHYLDRPEFTNPQYAAPRPRRRWWQKLGNVFRGRGWT